MITENPENGLPPLFFSVIVPFRGNHRQVQNLLETLEQQTFPKTSFEVILVDNGTDESSPIFNSEKIAIKNLRESRYSGSPYSARNRGIEHASGEVLAFIDANSYPDRHWLENAGKCLQSKQGELLAGAVKFDFDGNPTAAKIADSLISIQVEKSVRERHVAYTANLFVEKEIFSKIGSFEEGIRSGGDVRFCKKATNSGFTISYCGSSVVYKEARTFKALMGKKIRTGRGYYYTWITERSEGEKWYSNLIRMVFKVPSFTEIMRHPKVTWTNLVTVWSVIYFLRVVEQFAFIAEYSRNRKEKAISYQ